MSPRRIIPVAPALNGAPVVALEVTQNGAAPLDVRLVGCEGENPYVATIRQRNIASLKRKISDDDWHIVLSHFLLQKQPAGDKSHILEGLRIEYAPNGDNLQVTIRRDVQGIKVTLGEFELVRQDEEELNPVEWAFTAAQAHNVAIAEMEALKKRVQTEQSTIDKLNAQLEDFIKAKEEAETAMLQQFMVLLNEKKRKIRDQSRLLAGAKIDEKTATKVRAARQEAKPRRPGPSRTSKRKAPVKAAVAEEAESDADQMEIDEAKAEEQDAESGPEAATPDRTDDETEDEDEVRGSASSATAPQSQASSRTMQSSSKATAAELPASRELPFGRPNTRSKPAAKQPSPLPAADDGSGTEDEEEL